MMVMGFCQKKCLKIAVFGGHAFDAFSLGVPHLSWAKFDESSHKAKVVRIENSNKCLNNAVIFKNVQSCIRI